MSKAPSIFDTPAAADPRPAAATENGGAAKPGARKKKASPATTKKQLIDQLLREMSQEEDNNSSVEQPPPAKKSRKKKDTSGSSKADSSSNNNTSKSVKEKSAKKKPKKAGLKIKLQDLKKHKEKLRKSLQGVENSRHAAASESMLEASFNGNTLKDRSNHSTPVHHKTAKSSKKNKSKSHIMPLPLTFTPSKVVVKQEPKTPRKPAAEVREASSGLKDSVEVGREKFAWVIGPSITVDEFMAQFWEKKPFLVQRNDATYYANLLSREKIDAMLRNNHIEYTKNLDVTSYREGIRETHNPDGRALPPDVWAFYEEGCSIRMLNPQTYLPGVYEMNVKLQEFFHCMTGSNFYLTPPNSQGFAPHYDDIEAFVLQVEGRKHWKLYSPRTAAEVLARVSSPNFTQEEIGVPIMEVTLEPGDLLYFPRGIIHQASTVPGHHSLHVTMSVYQKNSWADLLELYLPHALSQAAENHLELRRGIPQDLHHHFGIVHSDNETPTRKELVKRMKSLVDRIFSEEAIDVAVDQLAKRFQHDALPPLLTDSERAQTAYGANYAFNSDGTVPLQTTFTERTTVRLLRRNIVRLVNEENTLRLYYHTENSREYHEFEPNFLEVDQDAALGVELLVKIYPEPVAIGALPVEDKVEFAKSLWEKGLIVASGK
uniref:Bifunctional lysine-specific demethylase and histidyl-hydroxylase n=1 Tax=Culex tarsalis TaxID=7177 RepID=A0A1Q3EYJ7_CULTA